MRVLSVLNQKGGVGKTTTSSALSHGLALSGNRVLAMDLDPQGHLGASLGADSDRPGMDSVLLDGASPEDLMRPAREGLQLLTAGARLMQVEQQGGGGPERGWRLKAAIDGMSDVADWVVIDCPPSSGLLVMNGLLAADDLLVPVSSDFLALQGLSTLMQTLQRVEQRLGAWSRKWLVLTRFHPRRRLPREVQDKLLEYFPDQLLRTAIRDNVALAEAPGFGQSIFEYQPDSNGAADYAALVEDLKQGRGTDGPQQPQRFRPQEARQRSAGLDEAGGRRRAAPAGASGPTGAGAPAAIGRGGPAAGTVTGNRTRRQRSRGIRTGAISRGGQPNGHPEQHPQKQ